MARSTPMPRHSDLVDADYAIADPLSRQLFLGLCRRYGVQVTCCDPAGRDPVAVRAPAAVLTRDLMPAFEAQNRALFAELNRLRASPARRPAPAAAPAPGKSCPIDEGALRHQPAAPSQVRAPSRAGRVKPAAADDLPGFPVALALAADWARPAGRA